MLIKPKHSPSWLKVAWSLSSLLIFASLACSLLTPKDASIQNHAAQSSETLEAVFIGQDGGSYAGRLCSSGTKNDNVHIHLTGLRTDFEPASYRVDDYAGGGVWATPCDPVSNWFLYVKPAVNGETDIFFKPFRDAADGTKYRITVAYSDGLTQVTVAQGLRVKP